MDQRLPASRSREPRRGAGLPLLFAFVRIPLIAVSAAATIAAFALAGTPVAFPTSPLISALYLAPVNIACLFLLRSVLRRDGRRVRDLVGFSARRLPRDIGWGMLWLVVLYLPFLLAVIGTMLILYGSGAFSSFEAVFAPSPTSTPVLPLTAGFVLAALVVVTFAPLNAPTEELVFRGYAQGGLYASLGSAWPAILIPAFGFGVQHVFFAATPAGMLVFGVAFFVWGVGSGLIYLRQKRLMPLIVCHVIVNLLTSLPALFVPFLLAD